MEASESHMDLEMARGVRLDMVGLLVACPYNQDNPDHCPLFYVRNRPMVDRLAWLDALNEDDLKLLYSNHRHCLFNKERSRFE